MIKMFFAIVAVGALGVALIFLLAAVKLSGDISRAEEQRRRAEVQWRRCDKCKHFITCESPKQYLITVTDTPCEEFEDEKSSN